MKSSQWLSGALLMLAYATFGRLLYTNNSSELIWLVTLVLVILKAGTLTLIWHPVRRFALRGFQSDVGYSVMVLVLASLAVLVVTQFRAFAYVVVLIATALLVRVDCLIAGMGDRWAFLTLIGLPLLGLGISWLPFVVFQGAEWAS